MVEERKVTDWQAKGEDRGESIESSRKVSAWLGLLCPHTIIQATRVNEEKIILSNINYSF